MFLSGTSPAIAVDCRADAQDLVLEDPRTEILRLAIDAPARDPFESDLDYQARAIRNVSDGIKKRHPEFNGGVSLSIPWSDQAKYDPNAQVLIIPTVGHQRYALGSIKVRQTGSKGWHGAYLASDDENSGTYESQNGYGAKVTVQEVDRRTVGFAWDPKTFKMGNNGSLGSPKQERLTGIPGSDARSIVSGLRAFVRGKLVYPFAGTERMGGIPHSETL
jgi:hypothetical protein